MSTLTGWKPLSACAIRKWLPWEHDEVLENGIAKAPLHDVLCKSFLHNWVRDENPYGVVAAGLLMKVG